MSSDLSDHYNKGLVPSPMPLHADVPPPQQPLPLSLPTHELDTQSNTEMRWVAVITLATLGTALICQALGGL